MRRKFRLLGTMLALFLVLLAALGATPGQVNPPQPFGPDFFSGRVSIQGGPPPVGMRFFACIGNCGVFKSEAVGVTAGGIYSQLVVNPKDRSLAGYPIRFYLANQFGRIQADETVGFKGATDYFTLDVTFGDPVPKPTPTPTITPTASLPVPGDPAVTAIPKVALLAGVAGVLLGSVILIVLRRRAM